MAEKETHPKHPAKDCQDTFTRAADMLGLDEEERTEFIHKCMAKAGHKPIVTWTDPAEGKEDRSGGWFPAS